MPAGSCMGCGGPSDMIITVERNPQLLAHYPACWAHLEAVCRAVRDVEGEPAPAAQAPRGDVLDVTSAVVPSADAIRERIGEIGLG